jgi:plasmid maintenance system antidote protein VapI
MSEKSQEERLARIREIIELLYGERGAPEMARRLGVAPTQLAVTLRGDRKVTTGLEGKIAKLVLTESVRIATNVQRARSLAVDIGAEFMGTEVKFMSHNVIDAWVRTPEEEDDGVDPKP